MQITSSNSHAPCTQPFPRDLTPAHNLTPWLLTHGLCAAELNLWSWVNWTPLQNFAKSATSLERQRSVVSASDVSRDFFRSRWASPSINPVCLLGWPFYINTFLGFFQKRGFLGNSKTKMSIRDILYNFFCLCWVFLSINLMCLLLDWLFYKGNARIIVVIQIKKHITLASIYSIIKCKLTYC